MNALLLSMLLSAAKAPTPPPVQDVPEQPWPRALLTVNLLNLPLAYPGVDLELPVSDNASVFVAGSVWIPSTQWMFRPIFPGSTLELGVRYYAAGSAPSGIYVEGHVHGIALQDNLQDGGVGVGGGVWLGTNTWMGHTVLSPAIGANVIVRPGGEVQWCPALKLSVGTWF